MTLFNQAIEILKLGNQDHAWKVAKMDNGLCVDITKNEWIKFAKAVIARREHECVFNKKYSR